MVDSELEHRFLVSDNRNTSLDLPFLEFQINPNKTVQEYIQQKLPYIAEVVDSQIGLASGMEDLFQTFWCSSIVTLQLLPLFL